MYFKRREPVLVLLFSIITCGIYTAYWMYQISKELGQYLQNDNSPALDCILGYLCFPYTIYLVYKFGKQVSEAQLKSGKSYTSDNSVLYIILAIFGFFIVDAVIIQSTINELV